MDKAQVIAMLTGIVTRGLAWVLATYCGYEAAKATDASTAAVNGAVAVVSVVAAVWQSYKSRKKLLMTEPPKQ